MSSVRDAPTGVGVASSALEASSSLETVFSPVRSQTAFEETVERIGTAIRLGLLQPGTRLPAERELCAKLGIARSTLRQALVALGQSGHLRATRGRGGGTFVVDRLPPAPPDDVSDRWRELCDQRLAVEVGIAVLACKRARSATLQLLEDLLSAMDESVEDFTTYRQLDVRFHLGLAEATGNSALVTAATETQGIATRLLALIAHPPEVLSSSNVQHWRILKAISSGDEGLTAREMVEHLRGTEHVIAGLLPGR
jgi:DNA-binding FadR family transcriptional regulator